MPSFNSSVTATNGRARRHLLSLPTEILVKILANLTAPELLAASLVASTFHNLITQHQLLQYHLQLWKHGAVDCAASIGREEDEGVATVKEKMERLMELEEGWEELDGEWKTLQLQEDFFVSDLQGGVFAHGTYKSGAQLSEPTGVRLHALPSILFSPSSPAPQPVELDLGEYMDLSFDPAQDLLVLIRLSPSRPTSLVEVMQPHRTSYELVLLRMDGTPKDGVSETVLAFDIRTLYPPISQNSFPAKVGRPLLHIMDGTLAVMISETGDMERDAVFAWNWRTGEEICQYFFDRPSILMSFTLLTPLSFLMTGYNVRTSVPCFTLYAFAGCFPQLEGTKPWPVRRYDLPRLRRDVFHTSVVCVDIRSETASSTGPGGGERWFVTDPRRGVVVVDLEAGRRIFQCHFLRSTLIAHLDDALHKEPTFLQRSPWARWGSQNCHLQEAGIERSCCNFSDGFRVVTADHIHGPSGTDAPAPLTDKRHLFLTDYNPAHLSLPSAPDDGTYSPDAWTKHEFPTVVRAGRVFEDDVWSCMARRTRVLAGDDGEGVACEAVMVDQERLIICAPAKDGKPRTFNILTL